MIQERFQRIKSVLQKRQTDLTLCLEHIHKPQNVSAILRTCDAVGIHEVNIVWNEHTYFRKGTAMGTQRWLRHLKHQSIDTAHQHFKQQDMQVLVTNLSDNSVDFRDIDYTRPTAIVMGQEKHGASAEAIALADQEIVIPMMGMVQSLNVSVAAALILYEAQQQRQKAGLYDKVRISDEDLNALLFEGCHPALFAQAKAKHLPIPQLDENGEVQASEQWWQAMQLSQTSDSARPDTSGKTATDDDLFSNI
ncbi:tRNA (guanosine(18)-2'-O)-methyltransferase TrmH [Planctobacterium marinum]|uniref:tRNA (guanosine(18)-2'-O)-methyltransferase TrmH n=1 Tax=Planctobacterium marinum TaxID=1631968 RepID=UPI001E308F54|nr:tRNA (guanosine(18)-2'-O)-methyltransferase TrmH [Planctobacterium marinum]MCC2607770.1 tRNA (guanosine(18)-2'-O)-methyltransferase TrmH [Planctobacterium marinum]